MQSVHKPLTTASQIMAWEPVLWVVVCSTSTPAGKDVGGRRGNAVFDMLALENAKCSLMIPFSLLTYYWD